MAEVTSTRNELLSRMPSFPWVTAILVIAAFYCFCWIVRSIDGTDYLELSLLGRYAITHGSPYNSKAVSAAYSEESRLAPTDSEPIPGFIYPPALIPVVAPFALLEYRLGVRLWFTALTFSALLAVYSLYRLKRLTRLATSLALVLLFASSVTQSAFLVGQGAMLIAAGVAFAVVCFAEKRWLFSAVGWSVIAMKPQIGIPFLVVAAAYGGRRGLVMAVVSAAALTLLGAILTGEPITTLSSYFPHASSNVFKIEYNRVVNDQIVGWNRAAYLLLGQEWNLPATGMIAGFCLYALSAKLLEMRATTDRISGAYWLAIAAVMGPVFGQAKGYDLVVLVLWLPYLVESVRAKRRADIILFLACLLVISIPRGIVLKYCAGNAYEAAILSYRTWATLILAAWLLFRGPIVTDEIEVRSDRGINQHHTV